MAAPTEPVVETPTSSEVAHSQELTDVDTPYSLQFPWTFWYKRPKEESQQRRHQWVASHQQLTDVKTVQDFWRVFNNLIAPSSLPEGADLYLFRTNIEPKWEDPQNQHGGDLSFYLQTQGGYEQNSDPDSVWLNILLHIIGDHFDDADEICGLIVSRKQRRGFRFNMWIRTANDVDARKRIEKQLKTFARLPKERKIKFLSHEDAMNGGRKHPKGY